MTFVSPCMGPHSPIGIAAIVDRQNWNYSNIAKYA
jgi:hypothetical protein